MSYLTPERTLSQRRIALARANYIRQRRAQLKQNVKAGLVDGIVVCGYILDPPDWLETMKISELLLSLPKYGGVKVNQVLKRVRISHTKSLSGLSPRQRDDLVSYLR